MMDCLIFLGWFAWQKHPSGPEIGHAFLSFSMMKVVFVLCKMLCFLCACNHSLVCSTANSPVICSKSVHSRHPNFRIRKMESFAFYHSPSVSFPSGQLAQGFASDFIYICVPMNIRPLPRFDIWHDHRSFARQATRQHFLACLPAAIYCTSVGNHWDYLFELYAQSG